MNLLHFGGYLQRGKVIPIARRFLIANCPEGEILDLTRRQSVQHSSSTLVRYCFSRFKEKKEGGKETKKTKTKTKPKQLYKKNSRTRTLSKIISVQAIRALPKDQ